MKDEKIRAGINRWFHISEDVASYEEIESRIVKAGMVTGTNLCILVPAILIASIGLNMNSTAVIIGAMLISPLMGSIMAMAYGIATANANYFRNSLLGFAFQIFVCLLTSTLYFTISPISSATSEILARTSPTIWDVLIASCGGFAGAIGTTRKDQYSNILPGVAIATALMPPLCTAGYGIATKSLQYFCGAIYLFMINTYFIGFTTVLVLLLLNVPVKPLHEKPNPLRRKRVHRKVLIGTLIFIFPSIVMGYRVTQETMRQENGSVFKQEDAYMTGKISKELKILYPEITKYEIGNVDKWESGQNNVSHILEAVVTVSKMPEKRDVEKLKRLIMLETGAKKVIVQEEQQMK